MGFVQIMARYEIFLKCSECENLHSVHTSIELAETDLNNSTLDVYFTERKIPGAISFMQANKYRCPHTKGLYAANDLSRAYFIEK